MRFFENSMWQSGRLGFEVPDPKTKESKASDIYVKAILGSDRSDISKSRNDEIRASWNKSAFWILDPVRGPGCSSGSFRTHFAFS